MLPQEHTCNYTPPSTVPKCMPFLNISEKLSVAFILMVYFNGALKLKMVC